MRKAQAELGRDYAALWVTRQPDHHADEETGRPRALLEVPDGAEAWALWQALRHAGFAVTWCPGPDRVRGRSGPPVTRESCPLMDDADVVVSALGAPAEQWRAVLKAQATLHPRTPVVVGASMTDTARLGSLPAGCRHLRAPLTTNLVVGAVERALATRRPCPKGPRTRCPPGDNETASS